MIDTVSGRRLGPLVAACIALVGATLAPLVVPAAAANALTCGDRNPLPPDLATELAYGYPGRRFTAVVTDRSGCTYSMNPSYRIGTASVVKLEFMAGVLLLAQQQGRGLTQWEQDQLWPMITQSANDPATALWNYLGQDPGMQQIDAAFGLTDTQHAGGVWGLTTTSAADQARLVSEVIPGMGGPLTAPYRAIARYYMTNVILEQRWGASAGVPFGWVVSQKNGFAGSQCCNWRINSVGWVERPDGTGWAISVLTDGWPTEQEGINAIQSVSQRINSAMVAPYFAGASSVISNSNRQDVFVRGPAGNVYQRMWLAGNFAGWVDVGGSTVSDPDAASPAPDAFPEVFSIGTDSAVWHAMWLNNRWTWFSVGGLCTSGPASVYSGPTRLDVFCRGTDGHLWTNTWRQPSGWSGWSSVGGFITSDPDAASAGDADTLTVVARGLDNALWMFTANAGTWSYQSLGGICTSGPGATFSGPDRLDVFCMGTDGQPWTRTWKQAGGWSGWSGIGGSAVSDPDGVSLGDGSLPRVFARGVDGSTYQWLLTNKGWGVQNWGQP
jgi:Beta-lactamase enzyme family